MLMPAQPTGATTAVAAVDVQDLSPSFDGIRPVLDRVSLRVAAGEFVALVGPSGCGKTTLLNLCAGLVDVRPQGSIAVCGQPVQLGSRCTAYMLARVGLAGFEDSYPKALSHGMRQRVASARTFAIDADLLLMDEPFGALDAQTKLQLQDLLLSLCQESKRTVVFVTHDLSEAVAVADRVVVMSSRPGRIVADVPVDLPRPRSIRALQRDPHFHALYAQLWSHLEHGWSSHEG